MQPGPERALRPFIGEALNGGLLQQGKGREDLEAEIFPAPDPAGALKVPDREEGMIDRFLREREVIVLH